MNRYKPLLLTNAPALGAALLWGLVECLALWRLRRGTRRTTHQRR